MLKKFINRLLIVIFFSHGVLYFIYPQDIYNEGSWIKLIKFVVLFLFLISNISSISKKNILRWLGATAGIFILMLMSHDIAQFMSGEGLKRFFLYVSPLLMIVITPIIDKYNYKKIPLHVIALGVLFAFIEYFYFNGIFTRFDHSENHGYIRIVSIFVNPNNAGLILSIGFIYINDYFQTTNFIHFLKKLLFLSAIIIAIFLTGSKTPLTILILYFILKLPYYFGKLFKYNKFGNMKYIVLVVLMLPILLIIPNKVNLDIFSYIRSFSLNTGEIRQNQFFDFFSFNILDSFLAPNYFNISQTYDIMYLQLWSDIGFIGIIIFFVLLLFIYLKRIRFYTNSAKVLFFLLLFSGFSLSFLIIWPIGYIFWYLAFSNNFYKNE